jgi:hypothetical protein
VVFFITIFFLKNSLRLISSGFYPALRTPSFRHPKDTENNFNIQQKKKYFSCLFRGCFVSLGMIQDKHLQTNKEIAEDTSRTPKERDLARILGIAEVLLAREMFESAQAILRIYLKEFEETVAS